MFGYTINKHINMWEYYVSCFILLAFRLKLSMANQQIIVLIKHQDNMLTIGHWLCDIISLEYYWNTTCNKD